MSTDPLATLITEYTDEPMWSAVVIAKRILASDWLAAHDAQVRADERQKVAALLADERTVEAMAEALGRHREDSTYPDSCVCEDAIPDRPNGRHYPGHAARAALDALAGLIGGTDA